VGKRHVIAAISDLHCGSTLGLCPPEVDLDDGGGYRASKAQRWLWDNHCDFWKQVEATRRGDHLTVIFNGDLTDGPEHHGTVQVVSRHPGVEFLILTQAVQPILAVKPDACVVIRGTEAHTGKSAAKEEAFAVWLKDQGMNVPGHHAGKTKSWWRFTGNFGGVIIDAAHHGRMGTRPWTKAGQVSNYAAQIFYEYTANARKPPNICLRAHHHRVADSYDMHPVRVVQMPAWQLATAFIHRIAPDAIADIGGLIITVEDGKVNVDKVLYKPTEGNVWVAPSR
jgi:hypothetical protein